MEDVLFFPHGGVLNSHIKKIYQLSNKHIVYNGYFYAEEEIFPLERILYFDKEMYHIHILKKTTIKDTSRYTHLSDVGHSVCFFPTETLRLDFILLKKCKGHHDFDQIANKIQKEEAPLLEKNEILRRERDKKEWLEDIRLSNSLKEVD
jgi:hypothetical protein